MGTRVTRVAYSRAARCGHAIPRGPARDRRPPRADRRSRGYGSAVHRTTLGTAISCERHSDRRSVDPSCVIVGTGSPGEQLEFTPRQGPRRPAAGLHAPHHHRSAGTAGVLGRGETLRRCGLSRIHSRGRAGDSGASSRPFRQGRGRDLCRGPTRSSFGLPRSRLAGCCPGHSTQPETADFRW